MSLDKKTIDRIKKEGLRYSTHIMTGWAQGSFEQKGQMKTYIAGATAEAERASREIERLKKIIHQTWNELYPHPEAVQDLWEEFKTKNNL
jgi:mannosyltransferase OCH1-like enzyme